MCVQEREWAEGELTSSVDVKLLNLNQTPLKVVGVAANCALQNSKREKKMCVLLLLPKSVFVWCGVVCQGRGEREREDGNIEEEEEQKKCVCDVIRNVRHREREREMVMIIEKSAFKRDGERGAW